MPSLARSPRPWSLAGAAPVLAAALIAPPLAAEGRPTLAGSWQAGAMIERWNVGDWGDACGPRPAPHGVAGGPITVTESGGELAFSGGGYPRTSGCFEMGGGINIVSHSASPRSWKTDCATGANDSRRAHIVTNVGATDASISFDETGEYQFVLKGQNCTASVRRNRTYALVRRLGDAPADAVTAAPGPSLAPVDGTPKETGRCDTPGEPAKLEVRPAQKLLRPGESFGFRALVLDAAGCRLSQAPAWSVGAGGPRVLVNQAGLVSVPADASEGDAPLQAAVAGHSVRVTVTVVSADHYSELLASKGVDNNGESADAAVTTLTTAGLGSSVASATDTARRRKAIFLGVVAAATFGLGAAGWALRKKRPDDVEIEEFVHAPPTTRVVRKSRLVPVTREPEARPPAPPVPVACPRCRRQFMASEGRRFCPHDGDALVPTGGEPTGAAPEPQADGATERGGKICPACGARYDDVARFCGREGATLVRVN